MTDPQLANNNSSSSSNNNHNNNNNSTNTNNNNNNNDGEPKYLHKKFKKMATTEMAAPMEFKKDIPIIVETTGPSEVAKERDNVKDITKESSRATETSTETEAEPTEAKKAGYVCPYCKLSCAKPSILQKHIRAHTRATETSTESEAEPTEARKAGYVCPYCKLSCAKPSVLQKHIRAHTNERPYPCVPCGFAFKTKSNLYKHCRSRAHALKMEGGGDAGKVRQQTEYLIQVVPQFL